MGQVSITRKFCRWKRAQQSMGLMLKENMLFLVTYVVSIKYVFVQVVFFFLVVLLIQNNIVNFVYVAGKTITFDATA